MPTVCPARLAMPEVIHGFPLQDWDGCAHMRTWARLTASLALGTLIAGCTSSPPLRPTPAPSATGTGAPVPLATPTPTLYIPPNPTPTPPLSPGELYPELVTFISQSVGFVIGPTTCGHTTCLRLATTRDAGVGWRWGTSTGLSSVTAAQWWRVRFANSLDGWISGPLLFATHDGGASWRPIHLPGLGTTYGGVAALEAADGHVYAEIAEGSGTNPGPTVLFGSRVSINSWYPVPAVSTMANGGPSGISVSQGVFTATLPSSGNVAIDVYRSGDGVSWRKVSPACGMSLSGFASSVTGITRTSIMAVCNTGGAAGSQGKVVYLSSDGGLTYQRVADPPIDGDTEATAGVGATLVIAAASGGTELYASFDSGRKWSTVVTLGSGGIPFTDLGFTTASQAVAIFGLPDYPSSFELYMTRDGGHQWIPTTVRPHV